ncbi:MAG: hypothetical protein H6Q53_859, partial [Deltaproteobacteria bacterium]|nr:hypothetical protein [Deltaproteobacteria bacterium]
MELHGYSLGDYFTPEWGDIPAKTRDLLLPG